MWIKKAFASAYFRGVVASLMPPLGLIVLASHQISQIATPNGLTFSNELIFLALSLSILHFPINLALPFAVNWIKAILAVIPTFFLLQLFGLKAFLILVISAIYGGGPGQRASWTFGEYLLEIILAAAASIVFARLGAGLGILLKKNTKNQDFSFLVYRCSSRAALS